MDTKAVTEFEFYVPTTEVDVEHLEILELKDHKEESFDPRNRNGSCLNS